MFCANHSRSTNHHQTLHTGKNVLFTQPNYFPLAAECHLLDQTSFRQQRKGIYSTKRASASSGTPFARPNRLPPTAECHLLGQTGFRQQRKTFARPNAICATATTPSFRSKGYSPLPPLPLAAPCLRTPAVKIAFFKQKTFGCGIFLKDSGCGGVI